MTRRGTGEAAAPAGAPKPAADAAPATGAAVHLVVRVFLADRPGALAQVAARIGALRADIASVDVLERGAGIAIDEFALSISDAGLVPALVREIEEVDGASVEEVRTVRAFPDARLDALESAVTLAESRDSAELRMALVTHVRDEFDGDWAALLVDGELVASTGPVPGAALAAALADGLATSAPVQGGASGPDDVALAPLPRHGASLLLARSARAFRTRERLQLLALARVADRVWDLVPPQARA